jgi:hypothetical protein
MVHDRSRTHGDSRIDSGRVLDSPSQVPREWHRSSKRRADITSRIHPIFNALLFCASLSKSASCLRKGRDTIRQIDPVKKPARGRRQRALRDVFDVDQRLNLFGLFECADGFRHP